MIDLKRVAEVNRNVSWECIAHEDYIADDRYALHEAVYGRLGFLFQPIMNCIKEHTQYHSADLMYDVFRMMNTIQHYEVEEVSEGELIILGVRDCGIDGEQSIAHAMSPDSCLGDVRKRYKGLYRITFSREENVFSFYLWEGKYSPIKEK